MGGRNFQFEGSYTQSDEDLAIAAGGRNFQFEGSYTSEWTFPRESSVEETFNLKEVTPGFGLPEQADLVEETFNLKEVTPQADDLLVGVAVEEAYNC